MDGKELLKIARKAIEAQLYEQEIEPDLSIKTTEGCFVTLHKKGELRGCIGYIIGHKALTQTIQEAAVAAAFHDPRFPAITEKEWPDITLEVSVLTKPQIIEEGDVLGILQQIEPGTHGLIISQGYRSGLLLPQVFDENTSPEEMLIMTCQKAGLHGHAWKEAGTEIHLFTAIVYTES